MFHAIAFICMSTSTCLSLIFPLSFVNTIRYTIQSYACLHRRDSYPIHEFKLLYVHMICGSVWLCVSSPFHSLLIAGSLHFTSIRIFACRVQSYRSFSSAHSTADNHVSFNSFRFFKRSLAFCTVHTLLYCVLYSEYTFRFAIL